MKTTLVRVTFPLDNAIIAKRRYFDIVRHYGPHLAVKGIFEEMLLSIYTQGLVDGSMVPKEMIEQREPQDFQI